MKGLWKYDAVVLGCLLLGIAGHHLIPPVEEVEAAAAAGEAVAQVTARIRHPSPPPSMRRDCLFKGLELIAWQSDRGDWMYDCVRARR